jgi:SAM-dependent methyltransferase
VAGNRRVPNTSDLEEGIFMTGLEAHYSARDIEARILVAVRAAGLNPEQRLSPEELGTLDHFHTGGLRASRELLELAQIRADDRVLDIGAGLAGPARLLASALGCRVDCLELSPDFCAGAVLLNRLTGLDERIEVHEGSALELPFPDDSFDVVWMQNVGMNIADKHKLYGEIYRVLKGTPFRRWRLGKRLRPTFRFRGPPTLPTASLFPPKRFTRCSARVDLSLNFSRIPATLI